MRYEYQTADPLLYEVLKKNAQYNRDNPTEAETLLWNYLKADGLGFRFKRQHIIGDYIVDFICLTCKLSIELDGGYHNEDIQQIKDKQRMEWLESRGYRVLRFSNEELFNGIDVVLRTIDDNLYV